MHSQNTHRVGVEELVCPGCGDAISPRPPVLAGVGEEFSHRDGSALCPDGRGRVGEPVEVAR